MGNDKVSAMLGFAQKAGKIAAGPNAAVSAYKKGKVKLLVLATDAAPASREELISLMPQVRMLEWGTKTLLGLCIGKSPRAALAVLDDGFAAVLERLITGGSDSGKE